MPAVPNTPLRANPPLGMAGTSSCDAVTLVPVTDQSLAGVLAPPTDPSARTMEAMDTPPKSKPIYKQEFEFAETGQRFRIG
ncbi:unnamed protein product [Leptosia nina]|uniref:Uncharacterized protein n=1 Tax=Leptosia nina TaxID=320188 RepID=A0AAV1J0L0_9NEOP